MKFCENSNDELIINLDGEYYVVNRFTFELLEALEDSNIARFKQKHQKSTLKINRYIKEINQKIANPEYYESNIQIKAPLKVQWKITNRCNLRCEHCYTNANDHENTDLEDSLLKRVANDIISAGIMEVTISGGEALLVKGIENIVTMLMNSGVSVLIFTNGILLKEFIDKLPDVTKHLLHFSVSIDGNEKIHDEIRGKGTFAKSIEGIKYAISHGYKLVTNTVIMKKNIGCIGALISYLHKMGVDQVQLSNLIIKGRANEKMQVTVSERKELMRQLSSIVNDIGETEILYAEIPDGQDDSEIYKITSKGNYFLGNEQWKCSAGIGKATINHRGDLLCCPFIEKSKLGNLLEHNLDELWKKKERYEFLKVLQMENNNSRKCMVIRE